MPWQIAIGLAIVANVATSLVQRRYAQKSVLPASWPAFMSYFFGVMPLGIIVGLVLPHHVHWSWWLGLLLFIEGTAMCLYNWIAFKAVKQLPVASYQTIYQTYAIVVIALGWTLLGEVLTGNQLFGAALLLIAALLAIYAPAKKISSAGLMTRKRAVLLTFLAAVFLGIGLVTEKAALGHMTVGAYLIFGYGVQTLALLLLAAVHAKSALHKLTGSEFKWSAIMGLANGITGVFYVIAIFNSDNISLMTAIGALTLPLLAIAAHFVLHERENPKLLWSGVFLAFAGLLVLAF
ncbi:MAG TPA: EamA family transporter [Nevskiaceae bacterium]|nr:EamA family transporter [Nevskiaceae bacterium]